MSELFVKKVSRILMSRLLKSTHLKKKMSRLLMRCLLTRTLMGTIISMIMIALIIYHVETTTACGQGVIAVMTLFQVSYNFQCGVIHKLH